MKYLVHLQAYSTLGVIQVVTTIREVHQEGTTEVVLMHATAVNDDGTDDPASFAREALVAALERI